MKKIFTLFIAFFAMIICAKAQVPIFSENFDSGTPTGWIILDSDGDTYSWENSTTTTSYFQASANISGTGHNQSTGHMLSGSYSNVYGVLTPDNWLITPAITLSNAAILTFWLCAQDAAYPNEHYGVYISTTTSSSPTPSDFTLLYEETIDANGGTRDQGTWKEKTVNLSNYTGQTVRIAFRHFNCSDEFILNLDDVVISEAPTSPTIVANPTSVNFNTVLLNSDATQQVTVTAYSLTAGITATTSSPFSVSADGTTYGTTATIAQTGGTLYVKYTPTAAGNDNGSVTLSSTGATDVTIQLAGACLDCSNTTIPYSCSFDDAAQLQCWSVIDANNDGVTFGASTAYGYAYYSYSTTNAADDYLISPSFTFTGSEMASFDYWVAGPNYPERFMVYAFGSDTLLLVDTLTATNTSSNIITQYIPLNTLTGNYSIAIHCISDADMFRLYIDNFSVISSTSASLSVNPAALDFGTIQSSATANAIFDVTVLNASSDITLSTSAPYSLSLDGTTYAASVTIPTPSSAVLTQTVHVAFNPTTGGTYTDEVVISTTGAADTVALNGVAVDCDVINQFPFTETFDATSTTVYCWQIVDNNNDDNSFEFDLTAGAAYYSYSSANAADDYLISPEIAVTSGLFGHIDYAVRSSGYPEKFSIYVIPENGTLANAVNIVPTVTVTNTTYETQNFDLSAYANQNVRVAIKAESDADMWTLYFTNFVVETLPTTASITVNPESMTFITEVGTTTDAQTATVNAYTLSSDITVTTAAPFEVSTDGNTFGATATIAQGSIVTGTLYVRYAPTASGTQTGTVTLTSGAATATISLTGEGVDCSAGITSLPYLHDFNDGVIPPFCWTYGSAENFVRLNVDEDDYGIAIGDVDHLISPEINVANTTMVLSFDYATYGGSSASSTFRVGYSTSSDISSFTWLAPVTVTEDIESFETYSATIPSGSKYFAIEATEIGEFTYYFWVYPNYILLDNIQLAEGVGIEENETNSVSLYPNPANNVVNVNASSNINSVEVFNMMGQRVAVIDANDTNVQINTTGLSNGMYMMRINTENGVSNQKFTVAR